MWKLLGLLYAVAPPCVRLRVIYTSLYVRHHPMLMQMRCIGSLACRLAIFGTQHSHTTEHKLGISRRAWGQGEPHDPLSSLEKRCPSQGSDGGHDINKGNTYGWRQDDTAFGICGEYARHKNLAGTLTSHLIAMVTGFCLELSRFGSQQRFRGDLWIWVCWM